MKRTRVVLFSVILVLVLLCGHVHNAEVDSFTMREEILSPGFPAINEALDAITNELLGEVLERVNSESASANKQNMCDRWLLARRIAESLGDTRVAGVSTMVGRLETIVNDGEFEFRNGTSISLPALRTPFLGGIYSKFSLLSERFVISSIANAVVRAAKVQSTRGHDVLVGADKLGHFFAQGFELYKVQRARFQQLRRAGKLTPHVALEKAIIHALQYSNRTEVSKNF